MPRLKITVNATLDGLPVGSPAVIEHDIVIPAPEATNITHVSVSGSDPNGDGSPSRPYRSLKHALTKASAGHTVKLSAGIFVENGPVHVPVGVSIEGAGADKTFIKTNPSFYYQTSGDFALDRWLLQVQSPSPVSGNQSLKGFTVDGEGRQLHGGIFVRNRNNIVIDSVRVQHTNFGGIWLWEMKDSKLINTQFLDCSWGSAAYSSGALNLGNLERVKIGNVDINEGRGYGIKAMGPNGHNLFNELKIHNSKISVDPVGLWADGQAPNIALELFFVKLAGCEIFNNYIDGTISLVDQVGLAPTGVRAIRVYNNILDMQSRALGKSYGVELSIHDAEIDHNYFIKGRNGFANWEPRPYHNWNIHHNVFYALEWEWPGEVVRSEKAGLQNLKFHNNTIEMTGTSTMNVLGAYAGACQNIEILNNLVINNNSGYNHWPNKLIHLAPAAAQSIGNLVVRNNCFFKLPVGNIRGTYTGNLINIDPQITATGDRPNPYYKPKAGSLLIGAGIGGINVGAL